MTSQTAPGRRPPRLDNRAALITGASQGLGLEIACAFARAGASVFLCGRDPAALKLAMETVGAFVNPGQSVHAFAGDVSQPDDVSRIVRRALEALPRLDILVNNAGIYGPMGPIEDVAWDEWVHAMQVNLFGSVLMCRALVPHLKRRRYGKIIQLSGGGATGPMPNISAYAASKAAIVRFAETLAGEVKEYGIDVNAIAPGPLNTRLLDELLEAGPERAGRQMYERSIKQKEQGGASLERGAALAVYLASSDSDGITGRLISAIWDPWETLAARRADLDATDIYTLRRIVPKDRDKDWK
jgi:NAD(P)-dependent dehydrogenase (short-subunit alcohol dehydrogenase family)